jgi:lipopolysaccharide export system protein LptA
MEKTMAKMLTIFITFFVLVAYAKQDIKNNKSNNVPVVIEADSFEYDNKEKIALYKGNVVVRKGDFTLWADTMKIFFDQNSKIQEIDAEGNVKFTKGEYSGKSDKAIYYASQDLIKLIGNAQVKKENNILEGDEIDYYIKQDRAVVIGKNRKVRTIIVPEEIKNKENKK